MRKFSLDSKLFIAFEVILIAIGLALSWYSANLEFENKKESLVLRARNIATLIDPRLIEDLSGSEADISKPSYIFLKSKMTELKGESRDARFVYLMGLRRDVDKLFFFVDSESPENVDAYSPPGQVYEETLEEDLDNFLRGVSSAFGPYTDRWGRWVSAYAPIYSESSEVPIAIVGIDVNATDMLLGIAYAAIMPFILSLFLVFVLLIFHRLKKREKENDLNDVKMEFTSFMSREINNFLTKMKEGLSYLGEEKLGALSDDEKAHVNDLIRRSDDFSTLVQEFLDVGRIEKDNEKDLRLTYFNLLDILKSALGDLQDQLNKKGISIIYEGNMPEKVYSICDNDKIGRVFFNVIGNAIKYSPEHSSIRLGYIDSDNAHTLYVKDEGIGIPEGDKSKIFTKFFRASNAKEKSLAGTGLGLYFSRLIIEKHKGRIWFESGERGGMTFFILIPK